MRRGGYFIESIEMFNRSARILLFWMTEIVLLVTFGALAIHLLSGLLSNAASASGNLFSADEIIRALGAAALFMALSGFAITAGILCAFFRHRLLAPSHAAFVLAAFVIHASIFLFVFFAPVVMSSGLLLVTAGTIAVACASGMQYVIWRNRA